MSGPSPPVTETETILLSGVFLVLLVLAMAFL